MIRKRGKPQKVNVELLINSFQKYKNDIVNSNQICSKDSKIWLEMLAEMNETIIPFSLYTYAYNNIYNIKNILFNRENLNKVINSTLKSSATLESSKDISESLITDDETDTFEISVSKQEFDTIIENRLHKRIGRNLNKKVSYRKNLDQVFIKNFLQNYFGKQDGCNPVQ